MKLATFLIVTYILCVIAEFVMLYEGAPAQRVFWYHTMRSFQWLAYQFGRVGMRAELNYRAELSEL